MYRQIASVLVLAGMCAACCAARIEAAPPWAALVPFQRIDADPKKAYLLSENEGPWMILAANFSGEGCEKQAHDLVLELRKKYKLEAYMYKRHFDDSQSQPGLGLNRYGNQKMMKPVNPLKFDEVAVLVGSFSSVEDSRAQKALQTLKYAKPDALDLTKLKMTSQTFAMLRTAHTMVNKENERQTAKKTPFMSAKRTELGPMRSAMVTRNPLAPEEFFRQGGLDKLVLSMNEGVENSLLDCPGQYSVKVATFRGQDTMKLNEIDGGAKERPVSDKLVKGAERAHLITQSLRKSGVEAYEFHDRHESIVTIGSFDSIGEPRADGKTEINPAVLQIIDSYKAQQQKVPNAAGAGVFPKVQAVGRERISFDIQPIPVAVPKRSIGDAYARE